MEKSFDLTAVACYHVSGDSMYKKKKELYNAEVKERFLSTIEDEKTAKTVRGHLKKFSTVEEKMGKDIAQMDIQDAIEATQELGIKSTPTVKNTLASTRKYAQWCVNNKAFPDCGAGFCDIKTADVEYSSAKVFFLNEDELLSSIKTVRDIENGEVEVPYLIFCWLGVDKKTIRTMKDFQVDLENRIIYSADGEVLVRDFSYKIRDILMAYKKCRVSIKYYGGSPSESYKDMSVDTFLKHFFTEKVMKAGSDKNIGKPFTVDAIRGATDRISADYEEKFGVRKLTPKNVETSGCLSRLLIAEIELGDDITAPKNRRLFDSIMKLTDKSRRNDYVSMYKKYKVARLKAI